MARVNPFRNFRFRLEIDGITTSAFLEASVPDTTGPGLLTRLLGIFTGRPQSENEKTDAAEQSKISQPVKHGNVTLKKGITDSLELYQWHKAIESTGPTGARKNVSLILVDEEGNDKARWDIAEAWPTKYDPSDFSAKGNEVMIETLELVNEGVTRVS